MLVLRRKEGDWLELTHQESGDMIRMRITNIRARAPKPGQVDVIFDDDRRLFEIRRPVAAATPAPSPPAA